MRQNTATYWVSDSCFETNTDCITQLGMRFGENLVINMIIAVLKWENFSVGKYIFRILSSFTLTIMKADMALKFFFPYPFLSHRSKEKAIP